MSAIHPYLAFWQSPEDRENFKIDNKLLITRMEIISAFSLYNLILRCSLPNWFLGVQVVNLLLYPLQQARATRSLNQIALNALKTSTDASSITKSLRYMETHPDVLRQYLKSGEVNSRYIENLVANISENFDSDPTEKKSRFESFKVLCDNKYITKDLFLKLPIKCQLYAIHSQAITSLNFNANETCNLWANVEDRELAETLSFSFDIHSKNEEGHTAIDLVIQEKNLRKICLLMRYGAVPTRGYYENDPSLLAALEQAKASDPKDFFNRKIDVLWLPSNFKSTSRYDKILNIALLAHAAIVSLCTFIFKTFNPYEFTALILVDSALLYSNSKMLGSFKSLQGEIQKSALDEFKSSFPHQEMMQYIAENKALFDQIPSKDFTKLSDYGSTFWNIFCKPERYEWSNLSSTDRLTNFKKLADHLFSQDMTNDQKFALFFEALQNKNYEFVEYLLKEKIKVADLTPEQQFSCWMNADKKTTQLLKKSGFDIEVQNDCGFTPLYLCLKNHQLHCKTDPLSHYDQISVLLDNGAEIDIQDEVTYYKGKKPITCTVDELIKNSTQQVQLAIKMHAKRSSRIRHSDLF